MYPHPFFYGFDFPVYAADEKLIAREKRKAKRTVKQKKKQMFPAFAKWKNTSAA